MTPKEKAITLVDLFYENAVGWDCYHDEPRNEKDILEDVKDICLKHIEEMIYESRGYNSERESYWIEVKEELNKL